ncbi:MarR family transcriptional regulator [Rhizobium sp. TH135]|jgi:MarR family transcriptional regulator, organic hydroperoxide resistance regulator|uniref:MarR family winged helix-turn-helix transcriptional regulator n=1 Tax=Rhizobium sp. TH135 TaxID=2067451 RepID=UPI000C7C50F5|nr:MarR family transcriptional regulator [Rhizobium sp. TH135]PLK69648.1 MarR family transcriptional regulator [Rhizobium sp. TH135]
MADKDEKSLDHQLCFAIYATSLAFTRAYRPLLEELDLTYPQYLAMRLLWAEDRLTVGQLAERLALESGTVTPLIKRLEQAGLLTRCRSRIDERQVNVHLTEKGIALKPVADRLNEDLKALVGPRFIDDENLVETLQSLRKVLVGDSR